MRQVRRAAVSGLFALWLAPLPALAGSEPSNAARSVAKGGWMREERWQEVGPLPGPEASGPDHQRKPSPPPSRRDRDGDDEA